MLHPYTYQELPKEHLDNLLKEARVNRKIKAKRTRQGNRFSIVQQLAETVDKLLVTKSGRLSDRYNSLNPLYGRRII